MIECPRRPPVGKFPEDDAARGACAQPKCADGRSNLEEPHRARSELLGRAVCSVIAEWRSIGRIATSHRRHTDAPATPIERVAYLRRNCTQNAGGVRILAAASALFAKPICGQHAVPDGRCQNAPWLAPLKWAVSPLYAPVVPPRLSSREAFAF